jgi:hypothetical protein
MVDIGTWSRLSVEEQSEFRALSSRFIKAVLATGTRDGFEFGDQYSIYEVDGFYYFATEINAEPLGGIKTKSKRVIDALFTDAVQNHGR